jgi:mono/diheme cytochrome c family protein
MSPDPKKPLIKAVDEAEPKAERSAAPIALVVLLALLVFGGMVSLSNNAGGFNAQVYQPYSGIEEVIEKQPKDETKIKVALGKKLFNNCAACHQANGMGVPGQFPPLAGSEWVASQSPNRIIRIVLNGLRGPVKVKDQEFGAVQMGHWRDFFPKDEDIAAILTYVRQNKEWGNNAPAVTPEQVKTIREKTKDRDIESPYTADELLKIPENE